MPRVSPAPLSACTLVGRSDAKPQPAAISCSVAGGSLAAGRRRSGRRAPRPRGGAARSGQRVRLNRFRRQRAAAEHDHDGHALGIGGRHERHADLDVDRGMRRVVDACRRAGGRRRACPAISHSRVATTDHATPGTAAGTRPTTSRSKSSTISAPPHVPPSIGRRDLRAALQLQRIGQDRIRIRERFVVVRGVRRRGIGVAAGAQRANAELLLHVAVIVGRASRPPCRRAAAGLRAHRRSRESARNSTRRRQGSARRRSSAWIPKELRRRQRYPAPVRRIEFE